MHFFYYFLAWSIPSPREPTIKIPEDHDLNLDNGQPEEIVDDLAEMVDSMNLSGVTELVQAKMQPPVAQFAENWFAVSSVPPISLSSEDHWKDYLHM